MVGRDASPEWGRRLPPDVLASLDAWLAANGTSLTFRAWFGDGRSGLPVALVTCDDHALGMRGAILKFVENADRARLLGNAWVQTPEPFRKRHLVRIVDKVIPVGSIFAIFMSVAGGRLDDVRPLNALIDEKDFSERIGRIVSSILNDWNEGMHRPADISPTVSQFLYAIIDRRWPAVRNWAARTDSATPAAK